MNATTRLGKQGRVVIPADIRNALGLVPGDPVHIRLDGPRIVVERPRDAIDERIDAATVRPLIVAAGVTNEPLTADDAELAGALRGVSGCRPLSLGDRCCLALTLRSTPPIVVTAERVWAKPDLPIEVRLIR